MLHTSSKSPAPRRVYNHPAAEAPIRLVGVVLLLTAGILVRLAPDTASIVDVRLEAAQRSSGRYVRFSEARPILAELAGQLPPELDRLTTVQAEQTWPSWIARHDGQVRARLEQGDEDTIVDWMLFGASFTSRPRAVLGAVEAGAGGDREEVLRRTIELISARLDDLLAPPRGPTSVGCSHAHCFSEEGLPRILRRRVRGHRCSTSAGGCRPLSHDGGTLLRPALLYREARTRG